MRYLEYEISTGKIISEIISETAPEPDEDRGVIALGNDDVIDTSKYIVKDGVLTKTFETKNEKLERERLRKERRQQCLERIKSITVEYVIAKLRHDDAAVEELEKEFNSFEAYL